MYRSILVPNNPYTPRLFPELAKEIGLNESILLLQIEFWIRTSTTEERDGRRWTYQSTRDIQAFFPFWSLDTIDRTIKSLAKKDFIFVGNYNKYRYDRTRWFALNEASLARLTSVSLETPFQNGTRSAQNRTRSPQNRTRSAQSGPTIPKITTENTTGSPETPPSAPPLLSMLDEHFRSIERERALADRISPGSLQEYEPSLESWEKLSGDRARER